MRLALAALVLAVIAACSDGPHAARPKTPAASGTKQAAHEPERGTPVSEIEAREVLLRLFRGAGLRIVEDVPLSLGARQLTVDGMDPERQIGFEYEDPREVGVELSEETRRALAGQASARILLLPPASVDYISQRATAFLAELPTDSP